MLLPLLLAAFSTQDGSTTPPDGRPVFESETMVITPGRAPDVALEVPYATERLEAELIDRRGYRSTPQALRDLPGVMVQETAHGQGSPYLRGFTGFRTLLLVDGVRVNNSVFRDGPNQYWNTVDPFSIDTLEVVKGPSSVLYGSDAIGGTVNAITKSPDLSDGARRYGGELFLRAATAENYGLGRIETFLVDPERWGLSIGTSIKDFGDVRGGDDIGTQENTGYEEWAGDAKFVTRVSADTQLVVAHQVVDQTDVPRTHRTIFAEPFEGTTVGSDLRRDLDQRRELTYVQLHSSGGDLFDSWVTNLSFQRQEEERDRIRSNGRREFTGFEVDTAGLWSHANVLTEAGELTFGFDYYSDDVDSFTDKLENQTPADDIQGAVADDASYDTLGVFVQDEIEVTERLDVTLGVRYDRAEADADSVRDPVTDERTDVDDDWDNVAGSVRFDYDIEADEVKLFGGVSQGFRAPNLSDLTRFDSARTDEFEVPSLDLEPEEFTAYELGVKIERESLALQLALFHTEIEDQIVRFPTGDVNADGDAEITKDNVGEGWVQGIELGAAYALDPAWTVFGVATWLDGEVDTFPTSAQNKESETIDRLMPLTLRAGVRWEDPGGRAWAELLGVHADDADDLSTRDESDTSRIPPGGTPNYTVFDVHAGYRVNADLKIGLGVENIADEDYRVHGSGSNRPGRNVVVSLRWSF
ncbi:MAG: TonB-dependent receptor [bacterium]|nr:TonB-dependent receptor [bacterium]